MFVPGIGESYVPMRIRLLAALSIAYVMAPALVPDIGMPPGSPLTLFSILFAEITIGIFFGLITRILINTLQTLGMIIAMQIGLATSMMFDPSQGGQNTPMGNFLILSAVTVIFAMDGHHVIFATIADSYQLFSPGEHPLRQDMAQYIAMLVNKSFSMAFQLAMPFVLLGLLVYLGAGVMARLMPNMQVFFVLIPLQILAGFVLMMVAFNGIIFTFINYYDAGIAGITSISP